MKHIGLIGGAVLGAVLGAMMVGGCQLARNEPPDVLDDTPIQVDPAMARRDWEASRATYAATGIQATPNLYTFQSHSYSWGRGYTPAFTETPLFLANVVLIPYQIFAAPLWRQHEYRAATIPPSYSAMPPLPESNENQMTAPPAPPEQDERPVEPPTTMPSNG